MFSSIWFYVILALVLALGGILIVGLPGAVYASLAEPVVCALRRLPMGAILAGDRAWPAALIMTVAVPPILPVLRLAQMRVLPDVNGWAQAGIVIAGFYLWSVIVLFALSF